MATNTIAEYRMTFSITCDPRVRLPLGRDTPAEVPEQYHRRMQELRRHIDAIAESHHLAAIGVAAVTAFVETRQAIEERLEAGFDAGLTFTFTAPETSTDLRRSFPWAERLVVASRTYLPAAGAPRPGPDQGVVARFAVDDPYAPLRAGLEEIGESLISAGHRAVVLADDNRLVDRAAAVRAGVGWAGKSTMVLDPRHGPWIVLGSVVTDAKLPVDEPMIRTCGTCDACIPACPTGAIVGPGVLDARRCLAAIAQSPGTIPTELRQAMGLRIYGCDDCLDACPPGAQLLEISTDARGSVDLVELLGAADEDVRLRFSHFYLPKNDPDVLRRNALVALGNQGDPGSVGAVSGYLTHPNPVLRAHAAWALGRIGGRRASAALRTALGRETAREVIDELIAASP